MLMARRIGKIERKTKETIVKVEVNLDGSGQTKVNTGVSFLDHMITSLGKHAMMNLTVDAKSRDRIDHHLIEDVGIGIGMAIDKALGTRSGIIRFGHASIPMDESLAEATIDLVKRSYSVIDIKLKRADIEGISREDLEHFVYSLLQNINACIHVTLQYGTNDHHKIEAVIKSIAVALRFATSKDSKQKGIPSTKGAM